MKALLIHVGADQSKKYKMTLGVNAPLFNDDTFEFIPILEFYYDDTYFLRKGGHNIIMQNGEEQEGELPTLETRTYSTMETRNKSFGRCLSDYLPQEYDDVVVHFDPDFEHFTYGDSVNTQKGTQISKLKEGDYIFFVESLAPYVKEVYAGRNKDLIKYYQQHNMAKFVIGYFKVQGVYYAIKAYDDPNPLLFIPPSGSESVDGEIDDNILNRIKNNAHTKREEDEYYLVVGYQSDSVLLTRAIKLTENGSPFKPSEIGRNVFGDVCYPRGVKWVYDPSRIQTLLNHCHSCM